MTPITRREFTRTLAAVGTTAALSSFRVLGANDRIRLGFIGLGNRGDQVLDAFLKHPDAQIVAICDIYQPYLDFAAQKIGTSPKQFKDYRKLLDLKDVDAEGKWQPLGKGICDLAALLGWLKRVDYRGWIVAEEESDAVWQDPTQAITVNRAALRSWGC